jgi:tetratricopeptide (TPR) repeat protein
MMKPLISFSILFILCVSCDEKTAKNYFDEGVKEFNISNYPSAIKSFNNSISKQSNNAQAYYYRAMSEVNIKNDSAALLSFQKAIELDSNNNFAIIERAKLKFTLGDFLGAIRDCERVKTKNSNFDNLYRIEGDAFEMLNELDKAIQCYESAIKHNQKDGASFYKLGRLLLAKGDNSRACSMLSKAGEFGYMEAYKIIKSNCNEAEQTQPKDKGETIDGKNNKIGRFKYYPQRYSITFPFDWQIDEISNINKTILTVSASKLGHFLTIMEIDPALTSPNFKCTSIYEIDKEEFISDMKTNHTNFVLLDFQKTKVDDIDAYYYKTSSSFVSKISGKTLSGISVLCVLLNPKTLKIYAIQGNADNTDILTYEPIYKQVINTFKFE